MNRINEIGDTPKGQEMLGRLQARNNWKQKGNTDRDIESYAKKHWIDNSGKRVYGGDLEKSYIDGNEKETNNIVKPLFKSVYDSIEKYKQRKNESKNMNKKLIRLTESDLHKIVKESVNKIINEIGDSPKGQFMLGRVYRRAEKRGDKDTAIRASNKAWDGSEGGGRNYRNFKSGIDFQNDMDTDKAYKSLHKILNHSVKEDYNPFDNDDFEEWDRTNVSPISDEEYNEIMRMNPMQNSSYIFNKIGFNKWNGFVSRWGKENPEECERFWQSQMAF